MNIIKIGDTPKLVKDFPFHQHECWEVLLNLEGEGTFYYDKRSAPFGRGTICVIPPGVKHRKTSGKGYADRALFIDKFRPIGRMDVRCLQDDEDGSVEQLFLLAERFYKKGGIVDHAVVNSLGDVLYHVLAGIYDDSRNKDIRLENVVEELHLNISNPDFSMEEMVRESGYSEGYFRRIFKEMTGQPPLQYLQQLRINQAKSLFQQYGKTRTIKEIAGQCGFEDPLYFSRTFRKSEGVSPRQYLDELYDGWNKQDADKL